MQIQSTNFSADAIAATSPAVAATFPLRETSASASAAKVAPDTSPPISTDIAANSFAGDASNNSDADIEQAVQAIDEALQPLGITLEFSRDDETHNIVIKVKDQTSGETLRQMPTEAMLHLSATIGSLQGKIFNRTI